MTPPTTKMQKRRDTPDPREVIELHTKASQKLKQLQEEYQTLCETGSKAAALRALQQAQKLETVVRALQSQAKQAPLES